jgi:hypothetical protein
LVVDGKTFTDFHISQPIRFHYTSKTPLERFASVFSGTDAVDFLLGSFGVLDNGFLPHRPPQPPQDTVFIRDDPEPRASLRVVGDQLYSLELGQNPMVYGHGIAWFNRDGGGEYTPLSGAFVDATNLRLRFHSDVALEQPSLFVVSGDYTNEVPVTVKEPSHIVTMEAPNLFQAVLFKAANVS